MTDDTTITDSERDLLRFPATADGVLNVCSPVYTAEGTWGVVVAIGDAPAGARALVADLLGVNWRLASGLTLDLTDATGRAHLAWWLHGHNCAPDTYSWTELNVPTLATIDPNDPRILPDGSRLVDALDLSLVGRHLLAGGGK